MGYMGFGLRKDIYTQKPKKLFSKFKKIIDVETTHHNPLQNIDTHQLTAKEKEALNIKINEINQKVFNKNLIAWIVAFIIIILIFILLNQVHGFKL